jgi:ribonuclease III
LLLGYHTKKELYKTAFIHKSFDHLNHNEQLEFLGDSILSSIVAELLFLENPKKEEGFLSQKKATIISRKHLNLVGRKIILESKIKSYLNPLPLSVFGNILEAIVGAIYIDKGMKQARIFVLKNIYNSEFLEELSDIDFKSKLLKYSQKERVEIEYKVEKQQGLDHQKEFLVAVFLNGKKITEAMSSSKKEAEQMAAKKAINSLF